MTRFDLATPFLDHVRDGMPPSLVPLGAIPDPMVAQGDPDVPGWRVRTRAGSAIGAVTGLIGDRARLRVHYLDVRIARARADDGRHVLVPIGVARLHETCDDVHLDTGVASLLDAPPYVRGTWSRDYERAVLESYGWRGAFNGADRSHEFYRGPYFDERAFFAARRSRTERSPVSSISRRILHAWERCAGSAQCSRRA